MYCIYIYFILFYIMYNIHIVKRFRAHCGFYAIENKLLLFIIIIFIASALRLPEGYGTGSGVHSVLGRPPPIK